MLVPPARLSVSSDRSKVSAPESAASRVTSERAMGSTVARSEGRPHATAGTAVWSRTSISTLLARSADAVVSTIMPQPSTDPAKAGETRVLSVGASAHLVDGRRDRHGYLRSVARQDGVGVEASEMIEGRRACPVTVVEDR